MGAELLKNAGVPGQSLQMVPSRVMDRDRTYASAVALRNWFREHNMPVRSINVVTEDVHARRTCLLFQKALGHNTTVGIIAIPNPDYDPEHWCRYTEGVKDVVSETVAYICQIPLPSVRTKTAFSQPPMNTKEHESRSPEVRISPQRTEKMRRASAGGQA